MCDKQDSKMYNKWKSRTFVLTVIWTSLIPLSVIAQVLIAKYGIEIPLTPLFTSSGLITALFIGGNKAVGIFREKNENAK